MRRSLMAMVKTISEYWLRIQSNFSPWLEEQLGELTEKEQKLVTALELMRIEKWSKSLRQVQCAASVLIDCVMSLPSMQEQLMTPAAD